MKLWSETSLRMKILDSQSLTSFPQWITTHSQEDRAADAPVRDQWTIARDSCFLNDIYLFVCVHIHRVCVQSEDNLQESFLSFSCMCPGNQTEAVILDDKHLYPFSHLAIPGRNNFLTQKNLSKEPIFKLTRKASISECPLSLGGHYSLPKLSHNI